MMKFKISEISDGLFVLFSSFLLAFAVIYYFLKNSLFTAVISICIAVSVFCVYSIFRRKQKGKLSIKREDEEKFIKSVNALCFLSREECENLVLETLIRIGKTPFKVANGIVCGENFFFVKFSYDKITVSEVVKAYKICPKGKNLNYIAVNFWPEAEDFVVGFSNRIRLIPFSQFFPLMQEVNCLPQGGFVPKRKKPSFLTLLRGSFSKKKSKTFALYGVALIIMSNFVFFPIWYIISGSLFLLYAILIKFFAPKITPSTFI